MNLRTPNRLFVPLVCLLAGAAAGYPVVSSALSADRQQPMHIEADRANIDDKQEVSVYGGNVIVTQGSMRVTSDKLTIYTKQGRLQRLIAVGNPATYQQRPDNKDQDVKAKAQEMEYYAGRNTIILTNGAKLWQGANTFTSNRIVYNVASDQVDAGDKAGGDRVRIVIQPQPDQESKQPAKK
jgi:lipopolysaccharide export system protein LptA